MRLQDIDHLVYGVHRLEDGIAAMEALTGVQAAMGGKHEGFGTHNALLGLGSDAFLEIIAPDPDHPDPQGPRPFGLDDLKKPRLIGWAAKTSDIESRVKTARERGYDPGQVLEASRRKPDGELLTWQLTMGPPLLQGGAIPFLMDWGKTPSPAETAPRGCAIMNLEISHPDVDQINITMAALGLDIRATKAKAFSMRALLQTPKREIRLR